MARDMLKGKTSMILAQQVRFVGDLRKRPSPASPRHPTLRSSEFLVSWKRLLTGFTGFSGFLSFFILSILSIHSSQFTHAFCRRYPENAVTPVTLVTRRNEKGGVPGLGFGVSGQRLSFQFAVHGPQLLICENLGNQRIKCSL